MANLLGIDLGTSSVKVLVADENGKILSGGSADYPLLTPKPGRVEQDPHDWWQAAVMAVRQAMTGLKGDPSLDGIGISGQMHGAVLLDHADHILNPAVIWPDQRSLPQVKEITDLIGRERLIEITGSPAATGFQAATLLWFQQNQRDVWRKTRRVLLPKDYLRWRMTGEFATDPSDAAGTLLLDGRNRTWSLHLLEQLHIESRFMPPIHPSLGEAGKLQLEAAAEMGLFSGTPVVVGAADTACSLLGAGMTASSDLLLTISTGGQLITPAKSFLFDRHGRLYTFCSALEPDSQQAGWYLMGATLSAGQSLRWLRDSIFNMRTAEAYPQMIAWAEQARIGADGLIFTPYLLGERSPLMDSQARGTFVGLTIRHGRAELVRAVLEGVVYSLYEMYLLLVENGLQPERVLLAGGGARSRFWMQLVADIFGLPVEKVAVEEQSAYGAALLAGAGIGLFDVVQGAQDWAKVDVQADPNWKAHAQYQELQTVFRAVYQNTRHLFGLN